jgi:DNA-binding response OmpR family regulator
MSRPTRVLLACGDLFFSTQLRSAAEAAGARVDLELSADRVLPRAATGDYTHLVLDVELPHLDLAAVVKSLPVEHRPRVIAFGPHMQTARLDAARVAGCVVVLSRGQISSNLAQWLENENPS